MILVDTSVWVDHLRTGEPALERALHTAMVLMHPFVLGEVACGTLRKRREVLDLLAKLPMAPTATDVEVLELIERRGLMGRGIGYVDVQLLASVMIGGTTRLWTRDRRLEKVAADLGLVFSSARRLD